MSSISDSIQEDINTHPVIMYMKGTPEAPKCGFSSVVCQILSRLGVTYVTRDVLDSEELRQGIKDFTQWPTVPQLYIKGEFIGGSDIVREMYQSGELAALLKDKGLLLPQA